MRLLLAISLALTAFGVSGCSGERSSGIKVNKAFRTIIPPSAKALAAVDLKHLKASPLYQRHAGEVERLLPDAEKVGLDPRRDVDYIGLVWDGEHALFFMEGRFDTRTLTSKLKKQGARSRSAGRYTILENQQNGVAFLSNHAALAGNNAAITKAIEVQENGTGEVPEELEQRMKTLPENDQFWIVSRGGLSLSQMPLRSDMQTNLSNFTKQIAGVSLGIGIESGTRLQGTLACVSPEGATRVHDALRGVIGLARLSTKDKDIDLLKVYDALHVDKDANLVRLHADFTPEQTERLLTLLPQVRTRGLHM